MENTSNYGLKRWDGEDRILHTEFNDNWDKIDTAIKGSADKAAAALAATTALEQKMGWQLLKSTTKILTNGGNHMQLDISNIDLTQYSTLHIRVDVTGNGYLFLGLQNEYLQKKSVLRQSRTDLPDAMDHAKRKCSSKWSLVRLQYPAAYWRQCHSAKFQKNQSLSWGQRFPDQRNAGLVR